MKTAEFPLKSLFASVLCLLSLLSICPAATVHFTVDVDGVQASAGRGTGSLARGAGTVTLDTSSNRLEWEVEFDAGALMDGALSVTAAHFHAGAIGVSGLPIEAPGNIVGSGSSPISGAATITDQAAQMLLKGTVYINIHTTAFPTGEIRGQVIPERALFAAVQDNTLFESATGSLSNGIGQHIFVGRDNGGNVKRGLVRFDLTEAALPVGAVITEAQLALHMSRTIVGSSSVSLHRVARAWGEGSSNAAANEGRGASARAGDATWLHTRFNTERWARAGGDFSADASAVTGVGGTGKYTWQTSPPMLEDLQDWLTNPDENFGWLLLGDEAFTSAKRFDSREHPNQNNRPLLEIAYELPCPFNLLGDLNGDCKVDWQDFLLMSENWLVDCREFPLSEACQPKTAE